MRVCMVIAGHENPFRADIMAEEFNSKYPSPNGPQQTRNPTFITGASFVSHTSGNARTAKTCHKRPGI